MKLDPFILYENNSSWTNRGKQKPEGFYKKM